MFAKMANNPWVAIAMAVPGFFDVVLDIGSHVGWTASFFRIFNPSAKIVAFEPCQITFDHLVRNTAGTGIETVKLALGDGSLGEMAMNEIAVSNKFVVSSEQVGGIKSVRLNEIVEKYALSGKHILMKLNCEGGEASILDHAPSIRALALADAICIEVHGFHLAHRFVRLFEKDFAKTHVLSPVRMGGRRSQPNFVVVSNLLIKHIASGASSMDVLDKLKIFQKKG
jgi:FkbM family methyltransferase